MPPLVACPKCEQHAKVSEDACPHCGAALRDTRGCILRTATAAVLGLAATTASCKKANEPVAEYGPAPTMTQPDEPATEYGPPPTVDDDPGPDPSASAAADPDSPPADEPVDEYGPPPTID